MNADEFAQSVRSLGTRYIEEYTRAAQRYTEFLNSIAQPGREQIAPGATDPKELQNRYAEFVAKQAPDVLARLSEASIKYYAALADLSVQTLNGFVDNVLQSGVSPAASRQTPPSRVALLFHGVRGQAATNAFLVSNNKDEAIEVEFDIAEVVSEDGAQRIRPSAEFTPGRCRLAPHAERVIQCSLPITDEFDATQSYGGSITVVGFPEMAMRFTVQVEEPAVALIKRPRQPARPQPAGRSARRRRPGKR